MAAPAYLTGTKKSRTFEPLSQPGPAYECVSTPRNVSRNMAQNYYCSWFSWLSVMLTLIS